MDSGADSSPISMVDRWEGPLSIDIGKPFPLSMHYLCKDNQISGVKI